MLIRVAFDWEYFKIFSRILPACINKNNDLSFVSSLERKKKNSHSSEEERREKMDSISP